jgi:hypothetical protein
LIADARNQRSFCRLWFDFPPRIERLAEALEVEPSQLIIASNDS